MIILTILIVTVSSNTTNVNGAQQDRVLDVAQVASAQLERKNKDTYTQPSEPILFPELRIYSADFPYLLCSIDLYIYIHIIYIYIYIHR